MDKKFSLGIDKFSIIDDYSDAQFAVVEIYICHDGNNLHDMPIALEVIEEAKKTLLNKPLVAGFDGVDFKGHEPFGGNYNKNEVVVGFFPESSQMKFEEKDGRTYLVAQAIMFKIYAKWAYDVFLGDNDRAVSMEITIIESEENEDDGLEHITKFIFNGVTLLGETHLPACEGANASIIKFSKENALEVYSKHFKKSSKIKNSYLESMKSAEISGKEDTEKMEKEKVETVEENMETETPKEDDDTVVMEDGGVKSEDGAEESAKDDEENTPEDEEKSFESLTNEQKFTIFREAASTQIGNYDWLEDFDDEYLYICLWECDSYNIYSFKYSLNGVTCDIDVESKTRVMRGGYVPFEKSNFEEGSNAEPEKDEKNEEVETLRNENCELKTKVVEYESKLAEYNAAKKEQEVESILSEVIEILPSDKISELREQSMNYSLDDLNGFQNEVKALAFEAVKDTKNKYSFNKMPVNEIAKPSIGNKYGWGK